MTTHRRADVKLLKSIGMSNVAIGRRLGISPSTVSRDLNRPKFVWVEHPHELLLSPSTNEFVEIDTNIAPLIRSLWDSGIVTLFCCEGTPYKNLEHNPASFNAAYIAMERTPRSMNLIRFMLLHFAPLAGNRATFFEFSVEKYEGVNRMCIRFPHDQISEMKNLVDELLRSENNGTS